MHVSLGATRQRKLGSHTPPRHRRMVITTLFSVFLAALLPLGRWGFRTPDAAKTENCAGNTCTVCALCATFGMYLSRKPPNFPLPNAWTTPQNPHIIRLSPSSSLPPPKPAAPFCLELVQFGTHLLVRRRGPTKGSIEGVLRRGPTKGSDKGVRRRGPSKRSHEGVRRRGPTKGSDEGVRRRGPTKGSDEGIQQRGPTKGSGKGVR